MDDNYAASTPSEQAARRLEDSVEKYPNCYQSREALEMDKGQPGGGRQALTAVGS
jgi:hypothetical protein